MAHVNNKATHFDTDEPAGEVLELHSKDVEPDGPRIRQSPAQYIRSLPKRLQNGCTKDCWFGALRANLKVLLLIVAIFAGTGKIHLPQSL